MKVERKMGIYERTDRKYRLNSLFSHIGRGGDGQLSLLTGIRDSEFANLKPCGGKFISKDETLLRRQ